MKGKVAERDKWVVENMEGEDEELFSQVPNVQCFNSFFQRQKEFPSSLSGLFSNGFSPSPDQFDSDRENMNMFIMNRKKNDGNFFNDVSNVPCMNGLLDEIGLSQNFSGMSIKEEQNSSNSSTGAIMRGFDIDGFGFGGFDDLSSDGNLGYSVKKHGGLYGGSFNSINGCFDDFEGFQSSPQVGVYGNQTLTNGGFDRDAFVSMGSSLVVAHNIQSNDLCSGSSWCNDQTDYLLEQRGSWSDRGIPSHNSSFSGPFLDDPSVFSHHCKMDSNDSLGAYKSVNPNLDLNAYDPVYRSLRLKERMRAMKNNEFSLLSMEGTGDFGAFSCEDSYIIQGNVLNHSSNKEGKPFSSNKMNSLYEMPLKNIRGKSIKPDSCMLAGEGWENDHRISSSSLLSMVPTVNSLNEVQGKICLLAQDQNGCRWLQRIFEEGTSRDIQIIFDEIVDHVVELMLKPFGNYVIQKFLDVCNEEQRMQVVLMVTEEPGQLLRICLNTYGTRAVQKLIETLKTRQQISSVVLALKPGFIDLVKDQNGNHVIQRCLQCLNNEDNKFIFDAAAKFCVQIATHRHGCCVMQRCITHAAGKHREKLIIEVSRNALLLAQDPFGNYVVQYIVELNSPSAAVNLLSQFKRHYVHLSMQKFSSHVVEKCLKHLEESREQIVHELISVTRFDQLLQDPFANYVIQSALAVTKGPLRSSLVAAVRPHVFLRTNPYSKRIFSRNLLKK